MNIDKHNLYALAKSTFWAKEDSSDDATIRVVDAVLAEVAKHETPELPTVYKTTDHQPGFVETSFSDGYVLGWRAGSRTWGPTHIDAFSPERILSAPAYWMHMPRDPLSREDQAFETLYASRPDSKEAKEVLKFVWDTALKYREEHPVK